MAEKDNLKLDKIDRKILFELDKNCRIPATQLATKVKKSRQAVEYRINNLLEKGIITSFKTSINPHKLGKKLYKIYLKLKNVPVEKVKMLSYLRKSERVYWIGECSGVWDLIFGIFAKDDFEFFELKNEFLSKFNKIIVKEEGGIIVDVHQYPKMYFAGGIAKPVLFGGKVIENKLDKKDLEILSYVSGNAKANVVEIAEKTKTTPSIVMTRLKKLEKLGIIIQYRLEVNTNKLNLENYKILVKLERYNKEDEKNFLKFVSNKTNVQYLIRNIWQLELEIVVKNSQEYYEFVESLKQEFPEVIQTIDSVLMIRDEWTTGFENMLKG